MDFSRDGPRGRRSRSLGHAPRGEEADPRFAARAHQGWFPTTYTLVRYVNSSHRPCGHITRHFHLVGSFISQARGHSPRGFPRVLAPSSSGSSDLRTVLDFTISTGDASTSSSGTVHSVVPAAMRSPS